MRRLVSDIFLLFLRISHTVLEKYELHEFKPLVESIRTGDLGTFNDGLVKYQDLFIR